MEINLRVIVNMTAMRLVAVLSVVLVLSGDVYGQTEHCCSPETFESDLRVSGELLGINLQVWQDSSLVCFVSTADIGEAGVALEISLK